MGDTSGKTLLTVADAVYTYPSSGKKALSGVSFSLGAGEYLALLGSNGSGKSTLARLAAGLLSPDSGSVSLAPAAPPFRVPVGMVFQSPGDQIVSETVELDAAFGPENLGLPRDAMRQIVASSLREFSLAGLEGALTADLPTGRKQHLALASVDALAPALLVLDEPTSMLAEAARGSLLSYLDALSARGVAILHVTHDLDEAARADRALVLDDGAVAFDGPPGELLSLDQGKLHRLGLSSGPEPAALAEPTACTEHGDAAPILSCRDLSFGPIESLSLEIFPGTVTAVAGESGSGKTVLLEILSGLRVPLFGAIPPAAELRSLTSLAVQESEASLFEEFVADDVAWGPANRGLAGEELRERVRISMNLAGLPFESFADRRTFSLSGGERRKAALAGIIALDTPVILLDEPFSALDMRSRAQLSSLIRSLAASGKAVVFTSTRDAERSAADRVVELPPPAEGARALSRRVHSQQTSSGPGADRELRSLERLRSGEAGLSSGGDSPLRRLPPLPKFLGTLSLCAAAVAVRGWPALLVLLGFLAIPAAAARLDRRRFLGGILRILPWLALLAGIQYVFLRNPAYAAEFFLRFFALYGILSIFVEITSHSEIMYGMEDLLSPLGRLGFPVRDMALVTGIVFRFISLLYGEAARIVTARLIRGGGGPKRGGPLSRKGFGAAISGAASLFVPLMLRTLSRADRLAEAIHARYYGREKNSRYLHWKSGRAGLILSIAVPVFSALLILASRLHRM